MSSPATMDEMIDHIKIVVRTARKVDLSELSLFCNPPQFLFNKITGFINKLF
jgi:hypothetical protein